MAVLLANLYKKCQRMDRLEAIHSHQSSNGSSMCRSLFRVRILGIGIYFDKGHLILRFGNENYLASAQNIKLTNQQDLGWT
jgi:hypothetical protein